MDDCQLERGRFAPSPSGALHIGSARTAVASFLAARDAGGAFILRVEDLDAARTPAGATETMLDDLRWLGLQWSEGPDVGGNAGPYLQSERRPLYDAALDLFRAEGRAYPCGCSRREVEQASQAPHGAEPVYPGTCRDRDAAAVIDEAARRGRGVAWRFRVTPGTVTIRDRIAGEFAQNVAADVGDFVIFRSDGVPAYQLAVVVDDVAMEITEVVRGDDLLSSAPRQVLLYQALRARVPRWAHVPLVVGDDGVRLAKRHGSISIRTLRDRGVPAQRMMRALLESLGAGHSLERARFEPAAIPRGPLALATLRRALPEIG